MSTTPDHIVFAGQRLERKPPAEPGFYVYITCSKAVAMAITVADPKAWATAPGYFGRLVPAPETLVQPEHGTQGA